jgi:hypothetical protein
MSWNDYKISSHILNTQRAKIIASLFDPIPFIGKLTSVHFKSSPRGSSVYAKYKFGELKISHACMKTEFGHKPRTQLGLLQEILTYGLIKDPNFYSISQTATKQLKEDTYRHHIEDDAHIAAQKLAKASLRFVPDLLDSYNKIDHGTRVDKQRANLIKLAKIRIKKSLTEAITDGLSMEDIQTIANESLVETLMRN